MILAKQILRRQTTSLCQGTTRAFAANNSSFASRVLMVEPTNFFLNEETFADNKFMTKVNMDQAQSSALAIEEFHRYAEEIRKAGVEVVTYKQQSPDLPDSVFPNNWFSTHRGEDFPDGLFVLYPMLAPTREREKNPKIVAEWGRKHYRHFIDLERGKPELALEGTGSLLFDVENKKIYCELSVRADQSLLLKFVDQFNKVSKNPYSLVKWHSFDPQGNPVYHTNCVMAILKDHVILCSESITEKKEREHIISEIISPSKNRSGMGRELIDINYQEMLDMAGNMIMVRQTPEKGGAHCVIMSERARKGLRKHNLQALESNYKVISADLKMIETIGGGSARCMVAELF